MRYTLQSSSLTQSLKMMERSIRWFAIASFLLMVFMATEMGPFMVAEARTCESQSHRFKGTCLRESNCAAVCQTEGFPGGSCRGVRRRCFCTRPC